MFLLALSLVHATMFCDSEIRVFTLSMLGEILTDDIVKYLCFCFQSLGLTFHLNCLPICMKFRRLFLGENIISLSSAEFAQSGKY